MPQENKAVNHTQAPFFFPFFSFFKVCYNNFHGFVGLTIPLLPIPSFHLFSLWIRSGMAL